MKEKEEVSPTQNPYTKFRLEKEAELNAHWEKVTAERQSISREIDRIREREMVWNHGFTKGRESQ